MKATKDMVRPWGSSRRQRMAIALCVAILVGAASAAYHLWILSSDPDQTRDFDPIWFGARALLSGADPYALVGPGLVFPWPWPLYHPLPALVAVAPLAWMPLDVARTTFVFLGAAAFGFALALRGGSWARWFVLISACWWTTVDLAQWSGFLTAAAIVPCLGVLLVVKPNIGLVVMAGARRRQDLVWPIAGGMLLLAISFVLQPDWVPHWLNAIADNQMRSAPVTRPLGWLLPLAAIRWRRPEARLFLALACVTQTPHIYDLLLLFLIPSTPIEYVVLALFSHLAMGQALVPEADQSGADTWLVWYGNLSVLWLFLPCLLMLLRRPNEGPAPAWFERRIARWPVWLRGRPQLPAPSATPQ